MLTKKDFIRIADIIRDADVPQTPYIYRPDLLKGFIDWFEEDNERFDYDKWLVYLEMQIDDGKTTMNVDD